jgi:hypothetical protein
MANDDRDDTTTAQAPVRGSLPEDEDVATAVTSIPLEDIARYEAEAEARKKASAAAAAKAAALSRPKSLSRPGSLSAAAAVAKAVVASQAAAPPPTEAAPSTEEDDADDSIVTMQTQSRLDDPPDDSIVTVQNMPKPGGVALPSGDGPSPMTVDPSTLKNLISSKQVVGRASKDDDIYDAEDDRTERRDLPSEEIERALMRAKSDSISISEVSISIHEDSPTARRQSPSPFDGPVPTLADPTQKSPRLAPTDDQNTLDLDTAAELARHAHESAKRQSMRGAMPSDSDAAVTEKRNAHKKKSGGFPAAEPSDSELATTNDAAAAVFPPPSTQRGAQGPAAVPVPNQTQRIDEIAKNAVQTAITAAAARAMMASDPSLEVFAFAERAKITGTGPVATESAQLQAVIPVMSSGPNAAVQPGNPALAATALPAPGQNGGSVGAQPVAPIAPPFGGPVGPPPPMAQLAQPMSSPPMSASMPVGPVSGNMHSASIPTGPPMSGHHPLNPPTHGGGNMVPSPFGAPPPVSPQTIAGGQIAAPASEPRWILLVLAVLAVCILIPAALYLALRPGQDEPLHSATPAKNATSVELSKPKDVGKRLR